MILKINRQRSHSSLLSEASRKDLLNKSRRDSKQRYSKRLNYQVSNFRGVDLSKFFNEDYFVYETPIKDYICTLAFPGVLTELKNVVKSTNGDATKINYQMVLKALRVAFDKTDDIKVRCTCADFKYRFMYWAYTNGYLYGPPTKGTEEFPEKTNPDDMLGATCKHLDLFLSNKRWLIKAASVVTSLIKTYPDKAATYLYDPEDIKTDDEDKVVDTVDEVEVEEEPVEEPTEEETPQDEEEINEEVPEEEDSDE